MMRKYHSYLFYASLACIWFDCNLNHWIVLAFIKKLFFLFLYYIIHWQPISSLGMTLVPLSLKLSVPPTYVWIILRSMKLTIFCFFQLWIVEVFNWVTSHPMLRDRQPFFWLIIYFAMDMVTPKNVWSVKFFYFPSICRVEFDSHHILGGGCPPPIFLIGISNYCTLKLRGPCLTMSYACLLIAYKVSTKI